MKIISLVFALVQISYVEPRYVLVPPCQCRVNFIPPAAQVHRVESCPNPKPKPGYSIPHEGFTHEYRSNAIPEVHTSRTLYSKAYPHHGPEFHDEKISYQSDYYPGHYEDFKIDSIFYEDGDLEVRHRRSVPPEDEHHHVHEEDYSEDWEDEVSEGVEDGDELTTDELNSAGVESADEGGEAVSETVWKRKGDLELGDVVSVSEADVKSIEKENIKGMLNKQEQNSEVMGQGSDEINSKNGTIGKKTKRSINDQPFRSQYRPSNQGYCSALDRYSNRGNHLYPNVHADDCTISKNLFFGCDMELADDNMKTTQRKARKVPKSLTEKINELKAKNEKLKNKAKLYKSKAGSQTKKVDKLENSLKKDNRLRSKRKDKEERLERELEAAAEKRSCPCEFDRNGACSCQLQPYYNPAPAPIQYFQNPMSYPVRRVYRQYAPPMPFHGYYRH